MESGKFKMEGRKDVGDLLPSTFLERMKFVSDLPKWKFLPGKNIFKPGKWGKLLWPSVSLTPIKLE